MSLRILIGHSRPGQRGTPSLIYVGESGTEMETARAAAVHIPSFSILNNSDAIRKNNPDYNPAAKPPEPAAKVEIPADLMSMKKPDLAAALADALVRIRELEATAAQTAPAESAPGTTADSDAQA